MARVRRFGRAPARRAKAGVLSGPLPPARGASRGPKATASLSAAWTGARRAIRFA
ncbi:hypothetical protein [Streptomyces solaniscabiei]|uniref:hypothetical protein n=1 Tax=Streptomyces solaniscabiei TaxID=2683255 RepID=UPI001CE2A6A8|nr:hypothetical protein [Streptomyces solaniscabiei]